MTLEERRKAAGLTQAQLAKKLDVGQTAISHWECGRWVPLNKYKRKLAKVFKCTVEELGFKEG